MSGNNDAASPLSKFTDKMTDVVYDYDSYLEHIELTKLAAQKTACASTCDREL